MCHARQNSQERRLCEHAPQPCTCATAHTNRQIVRYSYYVHIHISYPFWGGHHAAPPLLRLNPASVPGHARPPASAQQTGRTKQKRRIPQRLFPVFVEGT
jgi:hypothetical protein